MLQTVKRGMGPKSLMRRANGRRKLDRFPTVCLCVLIGSMLDGFKSELMRCVAMPLMGCPGFPFIGQGKAWVTVKEKRRARERERAEGL